MVGVVYTVLKYKKNIRACKEQSSGICRIFTVAFDRLLWVNVNDCPARIKPLAGARIEIGERLL